MAYVTLLPNYMCGILGLKGLIVPWHDLRYLSQAETTSYSITIETMGLASDYKGVGGQPTVIM